LERECLAEAIEKRRKEDDFEQSLSRALRRREQPYETYIHLMGMVREAAGKDRKDLFKVAEQLLGST
jgi:hypothetical protein